MSFEANAKSGVLNNYGPRDTNSSFGGQIGDCVVKWASLEFGAPTTTTSTAAGFGRTGLQVAAWGVQGIDLVIPARSVFLSADIVVETAFDALTGLTVGVYKAADGTTVTTGGAADSLVTAAACTLEMINAVGDRVKGAGALLATGTAGAGAIAEDGVIRVLYTGTVPTVGKARLIVSYVVKAA